MEAMSEMAFQRRWVSSLWSIRSPPYPKSEESVPAPDWEVFEVVESREKDRDMDKLRDEGVFDEGSTGNGVHPQGQGDRPSLPASREEVAVLIASFPVVRIK